MNPPANAAIYYSPEAFDTGGQKLMGRNVAGESFLRGFAKHGGVDSFFGCAANQAAFAHFRSNVRSGNPGARKFAWIPHGSIEEVGRVGCLFYPSPGVGTLAWQRRYSDARLFSICGVTYTISTNRVMDALGSLLTAPVQPWDALVCISDSVKRTILLVLEDWAAYLRSRLSAKPILPIHMPVIPLGVDCSQESQSRADPALRIKYRAELGIGEQEVAVLFLGRLSFHAKANPVPMYIALEQAAKRTGRKVHLILAGRFPNLEIENAFRSGAAALCPSVDLHVIDGKRPDCKAAAFSASDLFTSLSDNIQESFGLAPLEAKAAGLPAVVSDWDGYREIIRHGLDGFAVPTALPASGAGDLLARRHDLDQDNYDHYIGHVSQFTVVDIPACIEAYAALIGNPDLARAMGEAGRRHALAHFDWAVIIPAYQALWTELAERRKDADEIARPIPSQARRPLRPDPFAAFAGHASFSLDPGISVTIQGCETGKDLAFFGQLDLTSLSLRAALSLETCAAILGQLAGQNALRLGQILDRFTTLPERHGAERALAWLLKSGQVRFADVVTPRAVAAGAERNEDTFHASDDAGPVQASEPVFRKPA